MYELSRRGTVRYLAFFLVALRVSLGLISTYLTYYQPIDAQPR